MTILLSLGANLGDRRETLESALQRLAPAGIRLLRVSPAVESPALLPPDAPSDWNRPYLNIAAECESLLSPYELLDALKQIEAELGRTPSARWSPRPIDIDIVLFDNLVLNEERLKIPHVGMFERAFVLTPLAAIAPSRIIPGSNGRTVLAAERALRRPIPLWMGIINVTPDSFSDGGRHREWQAVQETIATMTESGAAYLDFGAESTRPGATALTADQEWARLAPVLEPAMDWLNARALRPAGSIDTYHPEVAARAIELGVDTINDVGGLLHPDMLTLAASDSVDWIAMHQLSLPADRELTLPAERSAPDQVDEWLDRRLTEWTRAGIALERVCFDPGVGFGKTPLQSMQILQDIDRFIRDDLRVLVGHSRKSFMRPIGGDDAQTRDLLTIGASLELGRRGVDVLRVHDVAAHVSAWRGFAHAQPI